MNYDRVVLRHLGGGAVAQLEEIAGYVEREVANATTRSAARMLDRLLREEGSVKPGDTLELSVTDRDALLAAVYVRTYGDRIDSTVQCRQCGNRYDMNFSLAELQRAVGLLGEPVPAVRATAKGIEFRVPTGRDELAVEALGPSAVQELRRRIAPAAQDEEMAELDAELERAAPALDADLNAQCPECGGQQSFRFNIQQYLLESLVLEQPRLWREVHRIAAAYGWGLESILSLRRSERRRLVDQIELAESSRR